jgi:hypothetical protein
MIATIIHEEFKFDSWSTVVVAIIGRTHTTVMVKRLNYQSVSSKIIVRTFLLLIEYEGAPPEV